MKVKATRLGWYGQERRFPGSVFVIKDDKHLDGPKKGQVKAFSSRWMVRVSEATPEVSEKPKATAAVEGVPDGAKPAGPAIPEKKDESSAQGQKPSTGDADII